MRSQRKFAQHFLEQTWVNKLVKSIKPQPSDLIVEIGAGRGALTLALAPSVYRLIAIEIDRGLAIRLAEHLPATVLLIPDDFLLVDLPEIIKPYTQHSRLRVVGNLPYNISTQILASLILVDKWPPWYEKLILMFQKEVAERILAKTNSKNYGRLSVVSNWRLEIKKEFDISPNSFFPKPKVESTLLSFIPKKKYFNINNPENLEKITKIFFNQRRKMIKNPLKQIFKKPGMILEKLKLDINLRPQNLSPLIYFKITKEYEDLVN